MTIPTSASSLLLNNVLHVPSLAYNLVSIHKLCMDWSKHLTHSPFMDWSKHPALGLLALAPFSSLIISHSILSIHLLLFIVKDLMLFFSFHMSMISFLQETHPLYFPPSLTFCLRNLPWRIYVPFISLLEFMPPFLWTTYFSRNENISMIFTDLVWVTPL